MFSCDKKNYFPVKIYSEIFMDEMIGCLGKTIQCFGDIFMKESIYKSGWFETGGRYIRVHYTSSFFMFVGNFP